MDGIAINSSTKERSFFIEKVIAAGDKVYCLKKPNHCVQIMTGAPLPQGCDCIIPIEQISLEDDTAYVNDWVTFKSKQFIRYQATDAKKGQLLLKSSTELLAVHIGVLASVGKAMVKVTAKPTIAVISTGDE
jgi:Molybdopterin biosynthesis enzyme